ncbi:LuxR family two component transcriptional regulator [Microcella putealis]|uniref:LuxR family two component transcriptional regulator n=1 Tax=Microcella putealis TaxID=337005 RepID=A0A4Q7LWR8_9MICO|nr:response regulator transcription factor [Microcella putealis]RZS59254.1 LuxR family two component transcriptional regulator [Microcella putealis]TQM19879.1 LuxR family two component transcriptional regulator [Microcella putealis]
MTTLIRVFLLDDHEIVRRGLADLLAAEDGVEVVGDAGRAEGAAEAILASGATVAVLDGRLPDGSGIDVCRDVKSADPSVGCLILTSYDDDEAVFAAVLAGADGYLLKEVRATNLVAGIRAVAAGQSLLDPAVVERVTARVREAASATTPLDGLTPRETEILTLIAEGLSNREIGARLFLAEKTVKNYVSGILAKLGMQRRTQAAVLAAEWLPKRGDANTR